MKPCKHSDQSLSLVTHDRQVSDTGDVRLVPEQRQVFLCLDCGRHIEKKDGKRQVIRLRYER